MRNFLTSLLGSLAALLIFGVLALLVIAGIIGAIVSAGMRRAQTAPADLESHSYLVFDLSTNITDAPPPFDFMAVGGGEGRERTLQLRPLIRAIQHAEHDDRIEGILLTGSLRPSALGSGYAALQEVRGALLHFRNSGKPVRAYLEFATTRDYYLASTANEVTLDPYGVIYMPGLAVEPMFYAGAFRKYGVGIQVTRVGKYKSYVEPFVRQDMSPENREETQRLLDDIWKSLETDVGRSRHISRQSVQDVVDSQGLIRADAAKKAHLVDSIAYRDQVIDRLRDLTGTESGTHTFRQIAIGQYLQQSIAESPSHLTANGLAVVYAEGDIVDGEGSPDDIGGVRFAREIRKLRQDDHVKAIVLRVNSPGGSATAAEAIQRELRLAVQAKPVVVSMGSYAASGGYWISTYGTRIFAEPTTITGSIGVFGIQFDVQQLANNFGLTFDRVKTGKFADALTISRPKTPEELAVLQGMVDWIYDNFVHKVSEGRHLPEAKVRDIAQGRVWSGIEAKQLGLVDQIGTLADAIKFASDQAGLGDRPRVMEYPQKKNFQEALAELLGRGEPETSDGGAHAGVVGEVEHALETQYKELKAYNDPRGVYARLPMDLTFHR